MKFTSLSFLLFFLVVYVLNWSIRGQWRLVFLFVASLLFYAAWSIPFAFHFLGLVAFNHFCNLKIQKNSKSWAFPILLFVNLTNLFLFKYFYFFWDSLLYLTGSSMFQPEVIRNFLDSQFGFESITLPLAISFYTFQMIAYSVDVKRGEAKENPNFLKYALFVFFFPQLVAGPIVRHGEFFYQLDRLSATKHQLFEGFYLVFLGLLKKVVVADNLSPVIDPVFLNPDQYDGLTNFMVLFGYAARIFCDFSGYTDMARGLGKLLGIDLPENFRAPYLSVSIRELWTRWHITLSSWIKDYIYFPLGGSRVSEFRSYINLLITFSLAGIWHGANITFLVWGFTHGVVLSIERKWELYRKSKGIDVRLPLPTYKKVLGTVYAFLFFCLMIPFFNAPDMPRAIQLLQFTFFGHAGERSPKLEFIFYSMLITFLFNYMQMKEDFPRKEWSTKKSLVFLTAFGFVSLILLGYLAPGGTEFIYFQF
ncbi:MBOAT family O-acyltransferase [Leptospira idonii]|uniref:MBOAT family protein n=1 Tax=Leptospira idonii TaxID=1193500 RepID=A0A4R9LWK7_9LEPT|nr:MBOAT family O-acyltransferase [Leptospira idonii]TGN18673.1 MBOAT family protein [Leptospira idonii]